MFDSAKIAALNDLEMIVYDYLVKHMDKAATMTIRELSSACHVSTSTIVRTSGKLGYAGFSELKYAMKQELQAKKISMIDYFYDAAIPVDNFLKRMNQDDYRQTLATAIQMIIAAKQITFIGIGTSGILGMYGSRYFINLGMNCYSITDVFTPVAPSGQDGNLVIVLSVSGETKETLTQLNEFKRYGAKILSITNNEHSTIARLADYNLSYYMPEITDNKEHSINLTTQVPVIALIEILAHQAHHERNQLK
uniref:MurR/RpiR family transcriptional regulator n=1 Tax=Candidatus Enterococcus willemsii TaxID=1857215 RepID=UPI00403F724C